MAENVTFHYGAPPGEEPVLALAGAGLMVRRGEFVAVVGPNGSGKSTLARMLNALLVPLRGRVTVDGLDTSDPANVWPIRDRVGMVFQNPDNQIVAAVVEEDVAFGPENQALPPAEIRQRVEEALAAVGLTAVRLRPPHLLSGGQKQRLAIAGALALRPTCLVLDEPTAMLDPRGRREVLETVRRLNREAGIAVVWITHFMEEAVPAHRVVVMDRGRVVLEGTPAQVFAQPDRLRAVRLEVPPAVAIAERLRSAGVPVPAGVLTLEELAAALGSPPALPEARAGTRPAPVRAAAGGAAAAAGSGHGAAAVGTSPDRRPVILEADRLTHVYGRGTPHEWVALRDVSLTIRAGEFWGIIGATGSGKSTLIQHFNGLLRPTGGRIRVFGIDLADRRADLRAVRRRVGLVFQYPEHQLFAATVEEEVAYGPRNLGLPPDEVKERVRWALEAVGLSPGLLPRSPFTLSGGQARRLALAGVLAMRPELLILDEPTAGLDPQGRREMLDLICSLHRSGMTVVLVSHSMDDVAEFAQQVLVLDRGRAIMQGPPRELFRRAAELEELGLGVPAAARLLGLLRDRGWPVRGEAVTIAGAVAEIAAAVRAGGGGHV